MKSRTIAIAASIAALGFAAAPVTAFAATHSHQPVKTATADQSRDAKGILHVDKSRDKGRDRADNSRDRVDDSRDLADR